jgi:hypothetical protein
MPQAKATVNKSQKVREMLNQLGLHASPTEISRRLAQQGIKVRPHMVSTLKNKMKKGRTGMGVAHKSNTSMHSKPSVEEIYAVWELGHKIGMNKLRMIVNQMPR